MKYTFITDTHLFATNSLKGIEFHPENENEILLGDIVDLANCRKKEVIKVQEYFERLRRLYGKRYVTGNHERELPIGEHYIFTSELNGRVFCIHGDAEANFDKWLAYRKKPKGAGFLKRAIWVNALELYESIFDRRVKKEILDRMADKAKSFECKTYICGHFHSDNIIDVVHKGVRILILPRGKTVLDL